MKISIPSRCMNCQFYEVINSWCYLYDKTVEDASTPMQWCWAKEIKLIPRANGMIWGDIDLNVDVDFSKLYDKFNPEEC